MIDVHVPKLNNNDARYVLVEWVAEDGAHVRAGDPLAVLETSKATEELVSEGEGLLSHQLLVGGECEPGQVIARLFGTERERNLFAGGGHEPSGPGEPGPARAGEPGGAGTGASPHDARPGSGGHDEPVITGPARALMERLGIGPERVRGLGKKIIRQSDVEALAGAPAPAAESDAYRSSEWSDAYRPSEPSKGYGSSEPYEAGEAGEIITLSRAQQRAAAVVELSHRTIPPAFTVMKVDVGAALAAGRALTKRLRTLVGLPELLVKAVGSVHARFPLFFAAPLDGRAVRGSLAPHVGVTFDVGRGLVIPVVRDAATRSLGDVSRALMGFRLSAMRGGLREQDLLGANIVVTLHNEPGVVLAIPIVFPGHACALSLAAPQREVVPDDAGGFTVKDVVYLGVAFDHRVVNGRDAVMFLDALRAALASPETLATQETDMSPNAIAPEAAPDSPEALSPQEALPSPGIPAPPQVAAVSQAVASPGVPVDADVAVSHEASASRAAHAEDGGTV
ncbi:dehydrogenase [Sphaerisporangium album]|uniref:Dihydrolipoamide acetyltransferase component of pyruvate dehydrogenase complex n=1 Tax=Sphaerisporangium album TaxID=509200 RepID=A0A367FTX1_9ACTN|nr:2-oxo acid dehydrogenase subunit E2 [Sphaerisporangium album]RCG33242.1 dehydrogenase [Sphaerisporangium album]